MDKKKKFNTRVFISFNLFLSFFMIVISGLILYLTPPGRVANWTNWTLIGFTKHDWQAVHTIFSYTFLIFGILHIFSFNWKAFLHYIRSKTTREMKQKKEMVYTAILVSALFLGTIFSVPPLVYVMDFGEYLTESWEVEEEVAPIAHAELMSIRQLTEDIDDVNEQQALNRLKNNKIIVDNSEEILEDIAEKNDKSPLELYNIIAKNTTEENVHGGSGTGIGLGRKTLEEYTSDEELDLEQVIKKLEEKGIKALKEQLLKDIANENDILPYELVEKMK